MVVYMKLYISSMFCSTIQNSSLSSNIFLSWKFVFEDVLILMRFKRYIFNISGIKFLKSVSKKTMRFCIKRWTLVTH